jgi:crotonobetainyl-CoA:carnitine CoA-transferase CaiB-like acyl-CoA transferase
VFGFECDVTCDADHPAIAWRRAGLCNITGRPDGAGLVAPLPLTIAADGALAALRAIGNDNTLPANGAMLLGERARLLGLSRQGTTSPNGSCRMLAAADGRIALSLARADDWELAPALFQEPARDWAEVAAAAERWSCADLVARGRLLGLAIAADGEVVAPREPFLMQRYGARHGMRRAVPVVVDLSTLWAGPLAGGLLRSVGATVMKVESLGRPDGARLGNRQFFDLLNGGKASVALDFSNAGDVERLRALIDRADIVIESARPRAMEQLGIFAADVARRGATWVSITAYGRAGDAGGWIGYGDDAAFAAGVAADMRDAWGEMLFAGDAIADPLTGIHAAFAGWASWRTGGGVVISLALAEIVAYARSIDAACLADIKECQEMAERDKSPLYPLRDICGAARALGADNALLEEGKEAVLS